MGASIMPSTSFQTCCLLILIPVLHAAIPACTRNRPSNGNHRMVTITEQVAATRANNDTAMAKLCCVYTWVRVDKEASSSRMVTYDGSVRTYSARDWETLSVQLLSEICDMSMGGKDCRECNIKRGRRGFFRKPWGIAVVVIAGILFLIGIVAAVCLCKR